MTDQPIAVAFLLDGTVHGFELDEIDVNTTFGHDQVTLEGFPVTSFSTGDITVTIHGRRWRRLREDEWQDGGFGALMEAMDHVEQRRREHPFGVWRIVLEHDVEDMTMRVSRTIHLAHGKPSVGELLKMMRVEYRGAMASLINRWRQMNPPEVDDDGS